MKIAERKLDIDSSCAKNSLRLGLKTSAGGRFFKFPQGKLTFVPRGVT